MGPAGSNAITQSTHQLEGTPHKNLKKQDFPKDKSNQFLLSAELLMCSLHSWFPKKNRLSPRFPKRIASADHFLSPKSPAFCNNGRCRHVLSCGPRFDRVCFCLEEKICALLADVCRPFSQVGDIKTLLSNLQSVRALSEEPLREAPPKNQDIPETESNQSLVSAKLLMCSFRSCFAQKNQLSPKSPARIASADHFLSPKSPAFCNNGRCRHVLSCAPRFFQG